MKFLKKGKVEVFYTEYFRDIALNNIGVCPLKYSVCRVYLTNGTSWFLSRSIISRPSPAV